MKPPIYNEDVEKLQIVLNRLGYPAGTVDGLRGKDTNHAIARYMKAEGIQGDSKDADPRQLLMKAGMEYVQAIAEKPHASHKETMALQQFLKAMGHDPGKLDGVRGKRTDKAIEEFMKDCTCEPSESAPQALQNTRPGIAASFAAAVTPGESDKDRIRYKISQGIQEFAEDAVARGVKYEFKIGYDAPVDTARINCSGFVFHAATAGMQSADGATVRMNGDGTTATFGVAPETYEALRACAAEQINKLGDEHGVTRITKLDDLREGMLIGMDTGKHGWDSGRPRGIDHIVAVYRDSESGELMVAQSSKSGHGANITPADEWLEKYKSARLFGVDLAQAMLEMPEPPAPPAAPFVAIEPKPLTMRPGSPGV